mmetsp:Transcript_89754/g.187515  ORF Transcript_89754/g.187515 Transcript_89754/m.187515 type:complete len:962 (-) Transcript_89754:347-3232(-)|eukprot:CAMPEP_0206477934 /NCGR_PEP_ID=MMETSP0324_2-20121206/35736_1 /ASSEMBLY_ACC=CAM_ASM_000836 /TAXON_ID=2866 /ORGANISM="Crypthecodinium cohnii, Strain Seligo" /LENGTH=961 /DNA_ID=CAMNT_0053954109 /DNA_START=197 /DNA_END=3082 /DNA_ORIENTATION=+
MSLVRKTYACPKCGAQFAKWLPCLAHIQTSGECQAVQQELDSPDDLEALQELCRNAANGATGLLQASQAHQPATPITPTKPAPKESNEGSPPTAPAGLATPEKPSRLDTNAAPEYGLDPSIDPRLNRALQAGKLSESERQDLDEKLDSLLAILPCSQQKLVLDHFFKQGPAILRYIQDKGAWLERCVRYVKERGPQAEETPGSCFAEVLREHCLLPNDMAGKDRLPPNVPVTVINQVATSLRKNILANVSLGDLPMFFLCTVGNEFAKYNATCPKEEQINTGATPLQGSDYDALMQLFKTESAQTLEAKALRCLGLRGYAKGDFAEIHAQKMSSDPKASHPLHEAAARSLPCICERLLVEGLSPNEAHGELGESPLHLAAAKANVEVVKVLLEHRAMPELQDRQGRTALYAAVQGAARLREEQDEDEPQHDLHLEVCRLLLLAGAEDSGTAVNAEGRTESAWELARRHGLHDLANMVRLHMRLVTGIKERFPGCTVAIPELSKLQFETALFVANIFSKHSNVSAAGALTELRALISSEFIKARDRVQKLGNRLAKKLKLSSRAIEALMELPPEAAEFALQTWKVMEETPENFRVPADLNDIITRSMPSELGDVPGKKELEKMLKDPDRYTGRIRKWDTDRGFGFILQDDEPPREMFVHRKNVLGSSLNNHIDLPEGSPVSYLVGEQDGKPRATEVFLLQEGGLPMPIHNIPGCPNSAAKVGILNNEDADGPLNEKDLSQMLIKYLRSGAVQDKAKEPRTRVDSYLRCIGVSRFTASRRDDQIWKAERNLRIDLFFERTIAPVLKEDVDPRVRRLLLECSTNSSIARVSEALAFIEESTSGKDRDSVRNWPGYLVKLLKGFDGRLQDSGLHRKPLPRAREDEEEGNHGMEDLYAQVEQDQDDRHSPEVSPPSSPAHRQQDVGQVSATLVGNAVERTDHLDGARDNNEQEVELVATNGGVIYQ